MNATITRTLAVSLIIAGVLLGNACSRGAQSTRHLQQAEKYFAAGRYDEAEIEFKNALRLEPANSPSYGRLGMMFQSQGRSAQAVPFLARAIELTPDDPNLHAQLGLALFAIGHLPEARNEAVAVLKQRPRDDVAPLLLAETAQSAKEIAATRDQLLALPAPAPAGAPVLVALGQLELKAQRLEAARALFEQALRADPKSSDASAALGMIHWARKDAAQAETDFARAAQNAGPRSPRRLQYAQFKLQTGDTAAAKRLLEEMTKAAPDYVPATLWRAEIALGEKNYALASELVAKVLTHDNMHAEALLLGGRIQLAKGDAARAVTELERMVGLYPQSALACYHLGLAYRAKGDRGRATENFHRATTLAPDLVPAVVALAEMNIATNDFNAATVGLKALLQKHPEVLPARLLLAEAFRVQGNLEEAIGLYQQIETQLPKDGQAPYLRGVASLAKRDLPSARVAFTRASELMPDPFAAIEQLINLDIAEKDFASARRRANAAANKSPKLAAPQVLMAKISLAEHDNTAAERELQRAIAIEPDAPVAYLLLARLYASTNQFEKATANLQRLVTKDPQDVRALTLLASLQDVKRDYATAKVTYEQLLAAAPDSVIALNNLAYLYAEHLNELSRSYELAQKAHALTPDEPRATDTLGWILFRKHDYAQALPLLQESGAKLADEPEVQFHLGACYYMLGQEQSARAVFERLLQQTATFPGRDDAVRQAALLGTNPDAPTANDRTRVDAALARKTDDPIAWSRRASWALHDGKLDEARQAAESAVHASPKNARAMLLLAQVLSAQGERAPAVARAKEARSLAPGDTDITYLLGRMVYGQGDYRWADSLLREAAEKRPDDPDVLFDAALAAYSVVRIPAAVSAAQQAVELGRPFSRLAAARRFLDLVSFSPADAGAPIAQQVQHTLESDPASVPALMASAALSQQRGDAKAAQQSYEKALTQFPDFAPAQKALALLYAADVSDVAKAVAVASKARQAYPGDPDVAKAFGVIEYHQGEYQRAATLLQESASARTADGELQFYLGMSQYELKNRTGSKRSLERALELGLNRDLAARARQRLATLN